MDLATLRKKVDEYRADLKKKSGGVCVSNENGPIGISLIDHLADAFEGLEERIAALEKRGSEGTK